MQIRMVRREGILPESNPFFIPETGTGPFASLVIPVGQWNDAGRPERLVVTVENADANVTDTSEIPVITGDFEVVQGPDNDMVEGVEHSVDVEVDSYRSIYETTPRPVPHARRRRYSHGGPVVAE